MGEGNRTDLVAGDTLFAVFLDRKMARTEILTVTKVGRTWLTLEENGREWGRCERGTLAVDGRGYNPRWRIYRDEAEYHLATARSAAWEAIRAAVSKAYVAPKHLTLEQLQDILRTVEVGDQ